MTAPTTAPLVPTVVRFKTTEPFTTLDGTARNPDGGTTFALRVQGSSTVLSYVYGQHHAGIPDIVNDAPGAFHIDIALDPAWEGLIVWWTWEGLGNPQVHDEGSMTVGRRDVDLSGSPITPPPGVEYLTLPFPDGGTDGMIVQKDHTSPTGFSLTTSATADVDAERIRAEAAEAALQTEITQVFNRQGGMLYASDYGVKGDATNPGGNITISGGTLDRGTLSFVPPTLRAGHTIIATGLTAPVRVDHIVGSTVFFVAPASGAVTAAGWFFGTDDTAALQAFFSDLFAQNADGWMVSGGNKHLVTDTIGRKPVSLVGNLNTNGINDPAGNVTLTSGTTKDLKTGDLVFQGTSFIGQVWNIISPTVFATNPAPAGASTGTALTVVGPRGGINLHVGGACQDSFRFPGSQDVAGTAFVWGGPQDGRAMVQMDRVSYLHWVGGVSFVGTGTDEVGGVYTATGLSPSIGYWVTQDAAYGGAGTGYHLFDDVVFEDFTTGTKGYQFGANAGDNNTDTSTFRRLTANRCAQVGEYHNIQSIAHSIEWAHHIACQRGVVIRSGCIKVGQLQLSGCDGSAHTENPGVTEGWYQFEQRGTAGDFNSLGSRIDLLRSEALSKQLVLVGEDQALTVGTFDDTGDDALGTVNNGNANMLYIEGGASFDAQTFTTASWNTNNSVGTAGTPLNCPIYLGSVAGRSPRLKLGTLICSGPGGTPLMQQIIGLNTNGTPDVSIDAVKTFSLASLSPINTKLRRGPVYLYAFTTDAATAKIMGFLADFFTQAVSGRGYSCRVPYGYFVIDCVIIGDHQDGTFSKFARRIEGFRNTTSGHSTDNATVLSVTTIGSDVVQGTDQLVVPPSGASATAPAIDNSPFFMLDIGVKGTTGKSILWHATCILLAGGGTRLVDV